MPYIDDEEYKQLQNSADKYNNIFLPIVFFGSLFGGILFFIWLADVTGY